MFLMTIPGALSTDTVWSCCPETAGCHEGSWFLLVHSVPFPPNQTQVSVFQVVDVAVLPFQSNHLALQRAWPLFMALHPGRMDGGWGRN